jgi:hypothetical protein
VVSAEVGGCQESEAKKQSTEQEMAAGESTLHALLSGERRNCGDWGDWAAAGHFVHDVRRLRDRKSRPYSLPEAEDSP